MSTEDLNAEINAIFSSPDDVPLEERALKYKNLGTLVSAILAKATAAKGLKYNATIEAVALREWAETNSPTGMTLVSATNITDAPDGSTSNHYICAICTATSNTIAMIAIDMNNNTTYQTVKYLEGEEYIWSDWSSGGGSGEIPLATETEIGGIKWTDMTWEEFEAIPEDERDPDTYYNVEGDPNEAGINPNLLDNPNFKINQRGLTTWDFTTIGAQPCVDRWYGIKGSLTDDGLTIASGSSIVQYLDGTYDNTTMTLTVYMADGTSISCNFTTVAEVSYYNKTEHDIFIEFGYSSEVDYLPYVAIRSEAGDIVVKSVKLEYGSVSTAYTDPNPADELLKIQSKDDFGKSNLSTGTTLPTIVNSQMVDNTNFIVNSNFAINQRGKTTYNSTIAEYGVDCWIKNAAINMTPTNPGVSITYNDSIVGYRNIYQKIENLHLLKGKTVTFSAKVNGSIFKCTTVIPEDLTDMTTIAKSPSVGATHIRLDYHTAFGDYLLCVIEEPTTIEWAKLEMGSEATLYTAPNPTLELLKCQRFYCTGYATFKMTQAYFNDNYLTIPFVRFPVKMRINPTIKLFSILGTPDTLTTWSGMTDSAYNFCEANTESYKDGIGFDSIRTIGGYASTNKFSSTDAVTYMFKYIAIAEP